MSCRYPAARPEGAGRALHRPNLRGVTWRRANSPSYNPEGNFSKAELVVCPGSFQHDRGDLPSHTDSPRPQAWKPGHADSTGTHRRTPDHHLLRPRCLVSDRVSRQLDDQLRSIGRRPHGDEYPPRPPIRILLGTGLRWRRAIHGGDRVHGVRAERICTRIDSDRPRGHSESPYLEDRSFGSCRTDGWLGSPERSCG